MKKGLSLLLAASLAFSAFTSAALAAEMTAEEKYEALVKEGIFSGYEDGQAHLDRTMNRAQAAKIVALILGLKEDAEAAGVFVDLEDPSVAWAKGYIGAALNEGIMIGVGGNKFDPSSDVTIEQLAKIFVEALDLDYDPEATYEGASEWAGGYVKAAVEAGLIPAQSDYTVPASRELLVVASYAAYEQVKGEEAVAELTATVTGAKKIKLAFNKAVDKSKVSVSVTNNNNPVNYANANWSDDNKELELVFANALAAADYVVTVTGVAEEALTAAVKVEAERVEKIEFTSDKAPIVRGSSNEIVTVSYKVSNQYGEDITAGTTLAASSTKGRANASDGVVTIDQATFQLNETITVNLLHTGGSKFVSGTFTVSPEARVSTVEFVGFENTADSKKEPQVGQAAGEYRFVLEFKDQYGNKMTNDLDIESDVLVTVSNPSVASVQGYNSTENKADFVIDGSKVTLPLAAGNFAQAGTSTVTIYSKTAPSNASYTVTVKQAVTIDTLTLSAPSVAPAGETIQIPFTAVDQFGNVIQHPTNDMLNSKTISNGDAASIKFRKDAVKNQTFLDVKVGNKGVAVLTLVTGTGKVAQLTINVTDAAIPTVITGTKNFDTAILKDNTVSVGKDNIVVKDQYNREITVSYATYAEGSAADDGKYRAVITTSSGSTVAVNNNGIVTDGQSVTLDGKAKGSSTITIKLQKFAYNAAEPANSKWNDVTNSAYSFTQRVVDKADIESYEATIAGTIFDRQGNVNYDASAYAKALTVKGVLADGTKVTIPNSADNYEVTINQDGKVVHVGGKIQADGYAFSGSNTTAEIPVIVLVKGATTQLLNITATISKDAPVISSLALKNVANVATKESDDLVSVVHAGHVQDIEEFATKVIAAKDQYGVDVTLQKSDFAAVAVTNISGADSLAEVGKEDSFTVTAITKNNKTIQFKVIVLDDAP